MRWITIGLLSLCLTAELAAAEPPLVEKYLHSGELAKGEQVLQSALDAAPQDDQLRLSLGFLQVIRGVERLGQSLYEYGCISEGSNTTFLRLPISKNPDATPVTYAAFRRFLDGFRHDLATAEATLSAVSDDDVKLPLRLADIHLDFTGDGKPDERLSGILTKLMGPRFRLPEGNPEFLVTIDRGDVAWLRAYCHLVMGMAELQLSADLEQQFNLNSEMLFANPKHKYTGPAEERGNKTDLAWEVLVVKDPARMGRFRKHLVAVCELNHESWRHIRAERDNDHEWLPNSKQQGAMGLPVTDEMIDAWLGMMDEFKALLNGKRVIPGWAGMFVHEKHNPQMGISLKALLDSPPEKFEWKRVREQGIAAKYLVPNGTEMDLSKIFRVGQVFQNSLSVGYAAWFN